MAAVWTGPALAELAELDAEEAELEASLEADEASELALEVTEASSEEMELASAPVAVASSELSEAWALSTLEVMEDRSDDRSLLTEDTALDTAEVIDEATSAELLELLAADEAEEAPESVV